MTRQWLCSMPRALGKTGHIVQTIVFQLKQGNYVRLISEDSRIKDRVREMLGKDSHLILKLEIVSENNPNKL